MLESVEDGQITGVDIFIKGKKEQLEKVWKGQNK